MTGMESKRLMALDRGGVSVDSLAKENRRLRVENAHFRGLVFYDEMLRDTIKKEEKENARLSEVIKKANSTIFNLKNDVAALEKKIKKLTEPPLPVVTEEDKKGEEPDEQTS
jgi:predicted nuclease with TOPRIM domain